MTGAQRGKWAPGQLVGCQVGCEEMHFCQRLSWGEDPADG